MLKKYLYHDLIKLIIDLWYKVENVLPWFSISGPQLRDFELKISIFIGFEIDLTTSTPLKSSEILTGGQLWKVTFFCEMLLFYSPTIFRNSPMGNLDILRLEKWHFMYFENRWNIKIFPWHFLKRFSQVCNYQ